MNHDSAYWNIVARQMLQGPHYLDDAIGRQKREAHLQLFKGWLNGHESGIALKTDLFEEAFGPDHLLSDLSRHFDLVIGMDISSLIVIQTKERLLDNTSKLARSKPPICLVVCDVRHLPFCQESLDAIVSNSTLDHFSVADDIVTSLHELASCLKAGGLLMVTLDNGNNIFDPLLRWLVRLGLAPYHIGPTFSIETLTNKLQAVGLTVTDRTALIHNPRILTTLIAWILRFLFPRQAERWIEAMLGFFDYLSKKQTRLRYLTGCFIAARAVKSDGANIS